MWDIIFVVKRDSKSKKIGTDVNDILKYFFAKFPKYALMPITSIII